MVDSSRTSGGPHQFSPEETLRRFDTPPEGLSQDQAEERLEKYGFNKIRREEGFSPLETFFAQFSDPLILLLFGAMILTLLIALTREPDKFLESIVIGVILVLNSVIGFVQEYRAEQSLEALRGMLEPTAIVIRNDQKQRIPAKELVPGDIIVLEAGQRVPADARLLGTSHIQTQESPLTGESTPVSKKVDVTLPADTPVAEQKNMVFMGTTVVKGKGKAVVTHTGMQSEFGGVSREVQSIEKETTPLMRRLRSFSKKLSILTLIIMIGAVATEYFQTRDLILALMTAIALSLSAVPEGLPAVITVMLSLGMRRMADKNAIVRRLSSVEGLGSTTVICADKTGTITKDEMTVTDLYVDGNYVTVTGKGYRPVGEFQLVEADDPPGEKSLHIKPPEEKEKEHGLTYMLRIFSLCNDTGLFLDDKEGKWKVTGDPTEGALRTLTRKGGMQKEDELKAYPQIDENTFSPSRKMMSTIHKTPEGGTIAFIKGAPETVLERSTHIFEDGEVKELTRRKRQEILEQVDSMTKNALRVLAAAYKPVTGEDYSTDVVEREMIFVGLAGMIDPPREGVHTALQLCRRAGIEVKIVTGDHLATATAIAKEIGLLRDEEEGVEKKTLTGQEIEKMNESELREAVRTVKVFARVAPEHKESIASALQANGEIVAMTGDGVNDAPAVKRADTGVSMGIKGTEVTKEASDMILADDDFSTIVTAVKEGRGIYGNIRTFLRFFLTSNIDEILIIGIGSFLAVGVIPLLPLQILWINLVTDGLIGTMLVFDTYEEDVMVRNPRDPEEGLLHGMLLFILVVALIQSAAGLSIFYLGLTVWNFPPRIVNTMVFTETIWFEMFSVWNCRSEKHSVWARGKNNFKNKGLLFGFLANIPLQLFLIYYPPLQSIFSTAPLGAIHWVIILLFSTLGLTHLPEVLIREERS